MKIRAGFVSNSSSSSFILSTKTYQTVFNAALAMLEIRTRDGWIECPEKSMIIKAKSLGVDPEMAVTFHTCNYNTFIFRHEGQLYVSTCNNHPWQDHLDYVNQGGGHDEGDFRDLETKIYFWYIPEDLVGKPITDEEWNAFVKDNPDLEISRSWPSCWMKDEDGRHMHIDHPVRTHEGEIVCPKCFRIAKRPGMILVPREYNGLIAPVKKRIKLR